MHRALDILEVLLMIYDHLPPRSLASLAQTCRSLCGPALFRLWKHVDHVGLVRIADMVVGSSDINELHSEKGDLWIGRRWQFMMTYTRLVQSLDLSAIRFEEQFQAKLARLALLHPPFPLLPNLRSLTIHASKPQYIDTVILFLGAPLEALYVQCGEKLSGIYSSRFAANEWAVPIAFLLEQLPSRSPWLQRLCLHAQMARGSPLQQVMTYAIERLPYLEMLHSDTLILDDIVFQRVALLPKLKDLRIGYHASGLSTDYVNSSVPADDNHFRALRSLCLHTRSAAAISLLSVVNSNLEELSFEWSIHPLSFSWMPEESTFTNECLASLASCITKNCGRVRKIQLSLRDDDDDDNDPSDDEDEAPEAIKWASLSPILQCRAVTCFRLDIASKQPLELQDSHVQSLAQSWPDLNTVGITWSSELVEPERLTIASLRSLAQYCRQLSFVELTTFDISQDMPSTPPSSIVSSNLRVQLRLGHVPLIRHQHQPIAAFLSSLWPGIDICFGNGFPYIFIAEWRLVVAMLGAIRCHGVFRDDPTQPNIPRRVITEALKLDTLTD